MEGNKGLCRQGQTCFLEDFPSLGIVSGSCVVIYDGHEVLPCKVWMELEHGRWFMGFSDDQKTA